MSQPRHVSEFLSGYLASITEWQGQGDATPVRDGLTHHAAPLSNNKGEESEGYNEMV